MLRVKKKHWLRSFRYWYSVTFHCWSSILALLLSNMMPGIELELDKPCCLQVCLRSCKICGIWEWHPKPSQLALSWLQLFMSTVARGMSFSFPGYCQQCIIWFHSCVHVIMQYFVILDCTLWENQFTTTGTSTTSSPTWHKFHNWLVFHQYDSYMTSSHLTSVTWQLWSYRCV